MSRILAMEFKGERLCLLDQRRLPRERVFFYCSTHAECEFAIKDMVIRGAPAIGAAAAYGVALAAIEFRGLPPSEFRPRMAAAMDRLAAARPTAVNLMWAIARMRGLLDSMPCASASEACEALMAEAGLIMREETEKCERLSRIGSELVPKGARILTHCNTGSLAVPGPGTALGVIKSAHTSGKVALVYADETRPRLQGARLTAWELLEEGIPATLIADGAAATLLREGKVDLVIVGADRIAANGDTANKIGTFGLSLAAARYKVPFYVAAPLSTIDFDCPSGDRIQIEERCAEEITTIEGIRVAPEGIAVYNPAFDVTPAENIAAIVTERGILSPPYRQSIGALR